MADAVKTHGSGRNNPFWVSQRDDVADAVRRYAGHTSYEIARMSHIDRHVMSRRLPVLEREGRVCRGDIRVCAITGRRAHIWLPAGAGAQ